MSAREPVILVADGNLSWGRGARVQWRRRGAHVSTAASVEDALREARTSPPDLLILDQALEGHQGRDLAELFRSEFPGTEIILLESSMGGSPAGAGLRLLFSGPRETASRELARLAEGVLGSRLKKVESDGERRPRRVLCVDDEEGFLKSLARMLTRRGYDVSAFNAAEPALKAIPWAKPDLALVDIMMPGMDGIDLAWRIRESYSGRVPVVLLTGLDTDEVHFEAHQRGASFLVNKGEAPERIVDVVDFLAGDLDEVERTLLEKSIKEM
jgi:DNA-binding response OmpR family regulator